MAAQQTVVPFDRGLRVEVDLDQDAVEKLSSARAEKLIKGLGAVRDTIQILASEAVVAFKDISNAVDIKELEIEAGIGIQAEGSVFLAKGTGNANLKIKIKISPHATNSEQAR